MNKRPKSWYYFIVDHDQKLFSVLGPISTEQALNETVIAAREAGRSVGSSSCWTAEEVQRTTRHWMASGYQQVNDAIVEAPEDKSAEYKGALPIYAQGADKAKIVKLLCGRCNTTRFAEMTTKYPGQEVLHKSDLGTLKAKCLMCGSMAIDPYNWHR